MLRSRGARRIGRQPDIAEWCKQNVAQIKEARTLRLKEEWGIGKWLKHGAELIREMRGARSKRKIAKAELKKKTPEELAAAAATEAKEENPLQQLMRSMELTRRFKWKNVTWDTGSDFDGFSNRLLNGNTNIASSVPAFSYLCVHLLKDHQQQGISSSSSSSSKNSSTSVTTSSSNKDDDKNKTAIDKNSSSTSTSSSSSSNKKLLTNSTMLLKQGDITSWFFTETDESSTKLEPFKRDATPVRSPFRIDWDSGEAFILDTASTDEVLSFLRGPAHAIQALQSRRADEEAAVATDIENARVALRAFSIKFNEFDRSIYNDAARKANPHLYVDPPHIKRFCESVGRNSVVMRYFLRDQNIRIVAPGQPYRIDPVTREICVPADFEEYHTAGIHGAVHPIQRMVCIFRQTWALWLLFVIIVFADTEFI